MNKGLSFACWVIFILFFKLSAVFFCFFLNKINFHKKKPSGINQSMCQNVGPDLGPNCFVETLIQMNGINEHSQFSFTGHCKGLSY